MDFFFVVFGGDNQHGARIRIVSEPWTFASYGNAELQHKRRFAATAVAGYNRDRAIRDHVPHDPFSFGRSDTPERCCRDDGQLSGAPLLLAWLCVGKGRRRRESAVIVLICRRRRSVAHGQQRRSAASRSARRTEAQLLPQPSSKGIQTLMG